MYYFEKYRSKRSKIIDIVVVSVTFTISIILIITVFIFLLFINPAKKRKAKEDYNNGIHAECGGHWIFDSRDYGTYIYKCDRCNELLNSIEKLD